MITTLLFPEVLSDEIRRDVIQRLDAVSATSRDMIPLPGNEFGQQIVRHAHLFLRHEEILHRHRHGPFLVLENETTGRMTISYRIHHSEGLLTTNKVGRRALLASHPTTAPYRIQDPLQLFRP